MSWAELFERAAAFHVTEAQVTERLAARRADRADAAGGPSEADDP